MRGTFRHHSTAPQYLPRLYYCSRESGNGSFWLEDYMRKSDPKPENCCPKK